MDGCKCVGRLDAPTIWSIEMLELMYGHKQLKCWKIIFPLHLYNHDKARFILMQYC